MIDYKELVSILSANDRPFKVPEIVVAVDREKAHRQEKNKAFHCFVVDVGSRASIRQASKKVTKSKSDQLNFVLSQLHSEMLKGRFQEGQRVQILVHQSTHWTGVDIEFRGNGEEDASFLILDAANDEKWQTVKDAIQKHFPKSALYVSAGGVQVDFENCSSFSAHHVFQSSKIEDLFRYLRSKQDEFIVVANGDRKYFAVDLFQLPPNLVMATQGARRLFETYFKKYPDLENYMIKKETRFSDLIKKHSRLIEVPNEERETNPSAPMYKMSLVNDYILDFRRREKQKVHSYAESKGKQYVNNLVNFQIQLEMNSLRKDHLPSYNKRSIGDIMSTKVATDLPEVKQKGETEIPPLEDRMKGFFASQPKEKVNKVQKEDSKELSDDEKKDIEP